MKLGVENTHTHTQRTHTTHTTHTTHARAQKLWDVTSTSAMIYTSSQCSARTSTVLVLSEFNRSKTHMSCIGSFKSWIWSSDLTLLSQILRKISLSLVLVPVSSSLEEHNTQEPTRPQEEIPLVGHLFLKQKSQEKPPSPENIPPGLAHIKKTTTGVGCAAFVVWDTRFWERFFLFIYLFFLARFLAASCSDILPIK